MSQFELIQRLEGHHGEIWALAVSNQGNFVVTGSHDKSIRIWEKTDEPLFLEEERERELEAMYDATLAEGLDGERAGGNEGEEVEAVQKQTAETLMAGERIMEAIELADAEREVVRQWEEDKAKLQPAQADALQRPPKNPELVARGDLEPAEHVLKTIQKVPAAGMEDALLVLPFRMVVSLLEYLDEWAKSVSRIAPRAVSTGADAFSSQDTDIVLTSRLLSFLLRTNHSQIVANRIMRTPLLALRTHLRAALTKQRETVGYNLAALKFLRGKWESEKVAGLLEEEFDEEKVRRRIEKGRGKRKRVEVRA
jgi:U3 small nucleolar RNA-associated protein 12